MNFVLKFFELIVADHKSRKKKNESITTHLEKAYEECLLPYQTWMFTHLMKV